MNSMKRLILVLAALAGSPAWSITTRGDISCAKWVADQPLTLIAGRNTGWLLGYLSGWAKARKWDILKDEQLTVEMLEAWMNNYCKQNALRYASEAADELLVELLNNSAKLLDEETEALKRRKSP